MLRQIAYQGAPGAFGEEACRRFLPDWEPNPLPTFAAVAEAVRSGEAERGMLPVRNSTAGPVPGVEALIRDNRLLVIGRHALDVRLHLMGVRGARVEDITRVASHPMALAQSARWISARGLEREEAANTALAAQALASSGDRTLGVIASEAAATTYGLVILMRDIQDRDDNVTTFCVVGPSGGGEI